MIAGPIGTFQYNGETINGVTLIDIVTQVASLPDDVDTIRIQYDTPGGEKQAGKNIYNYLLSIKKKYKLISEQIGMVGSIGTMPWFAADVRIATRGEDFFIHNPWTPNFSGDADALAQMSESLKETETELKQFYMTHTGFGEEAIAPLMKAETTFRDEAAVNMKFATELQEALKIAAYTMTKKNEQTLGQKVDALLAFIKNGFKDETALNMVVELEGSSDKLFIQTEDATKLEGMPVMTVDPATGAPTQVPAPDKEYVLKGMNKKITVAGGKVSKVEDVAPAAAPPVEGGETAIALSKSFDALSEAIKANKPVTKQELELMIATEITKLKSEIQSVHTPPIKKSETHDADVKEWDRSFRANEHVAMKKNEPEKYKKLFFAKYGKLPN